MPIDFSNLGPLSDLDISATSESGAEMVVKHFATGEPLVGKCGPLAIVLAGRDSDRFMRVETEMRQYRLDRAERRNGAPVTPQQERDEQIEYLARMTIGWKGFGSDPAAPLPFSIENAREIYGRFAWLRDDAERFIVGRRNFLTAPRNDS